MSEWLAVEAIVRQRDKEKTAHAFAKLSSESGANDKIKGLVIDSEIENDVFEENGFSDLSDPESYEDDGQTDRTDVCKSIQKDVKSDFAAEKKPRCTKSSTDSGNVADAEDNRFDDGIYDSIKEVDDNIELGNNEDNQNVPICSTKSSTSTSSYETVGNDFVDLFDSIPDNVKCEEYMANDDIFAKNSQERSDELAADDEKEIPIEMHHSVIITNASIDIVNLQQNDDEMNDGGGDEKEAMGAVDAQQDESQNTYTSTLDALQEPKSACVSPASSNGGIYSVNFKFNSF